MTPARIEELQRIAALASAGYPIEPAQIVKLGEALARLLPAIIRWREAELAHSRGLRGQSDIRESCLAEDNLAAVIDELGLPPRRYMGPLL